MASKKKRTPIQWSSIGKAFKLLFVLSGKQAKFLFKKQVEGTKTPYEWIDLLTNLAEYDKHSDQARKIIKVLAWIFLGIVFFEHLFGFQLDKLLPQLSAYGELIFRVFVLLAFLLWLCYTFLKVGDLSNHLRLFLVPLMSVLSEEIADGGTIEMKLDLRSRTSRRFRTDLQFDYAPLRYYLDRFKWILVYITLFLFAMSEYPAMFYVTEESRWLFSEIFHLTTGIGIPLHTLFSYSIGLLIFLVIATFIINMASSYPRTTTRVYTFPWLSFTAKLADGSILNSQLTDVVRKRKRVNKNFRGKIKTKKKDTVVTLYEVNIGFPQKTYDIDIKANNAKSNVKIKMKPNDKRHIFRLKGKDKALGLETFPSLQRYLSFVATAYNRMKQPA